MAERSRTTKKTTRRKTTTRAKTTTASAARKTSGTGRKTRKAPIGITEQQVRERAYQIFLTRNGMVGDAASDWYQAERELRDVLKV